MEVGYKAILRFLSSDDTNFIIPFYQRNYAWSIKQCDVLLKDIDNIIDMSNN